jgi:hypothetical protein
MQWGGTQGWPAPNPSGARQGSAGSSSSQLQGTSQNIPSGSGTSYQNYTGMQYLATTANPALTVVPQHATNSKGQFNPYYVQPMNYSAVTQPPPPAFPSRPAPPPTSIQEKEDALALAIKRYLEAGPTTTSDSSSVPSSSPTMAVPPPPPLPPGDIHTGSPSTWQTSNIKSPTASTSGATKSPATASANTTDLSQKHAEQHRADPLSPPPPPKEHRRESAHAKASADDRGRSRRSDDHPVFELDIAAAAAADDRSKQPPPPSRPPPPTQPAPGAHKSAPPAAAAAAGKEYPVKKLVAEFVKRRSVLKNLWNHDRIDKTQVETRI